MDSTRYELMEVEDWGSVKKEIGQLRNEVWKLVDAQSDMGWEEMDESPNARHWIVRERGEGGEKIVAAARLTMHHDLQGDDYRDIKLWRDKGIELQAPVVDFGRLVVKDGHKRQGLGLALTMIRVEAAKVWGARTGVSTVSSTSVDFLKRLGFREIGATAVFADRPNVTFVALQIDFYS
jgi:predicted GNAT family N-acyltransferase